MASPAQPQPVPVPSPRSPPGFRSVIFDSQQLGQQPYLEHLQSLVNEAYLASHLDVLSLNENSYRCDTPDTLVKELGVHGRCCLVFRDEDRQMLKPVAVAMIKCFNADLGADPIRRVAVKAGSSFSITTNGCGIIVTGYKQEPTELLDIEHWEPTAVAISAKDPSLRRLGLATHCVAELERDLLERIQTAQMEKLECTMATDNGVETTSSSSSQSQTITFWIRATTRSNAPYWARRGYEPLFVDSFAAGFWGARLDFEVMTLRKVIPCYSTTEC